MKTTTRTKGVKVTVAQWESAWADYIDALKAFDGTFPERHKPLRVRLHNASKKLLGAARKRLEKLDPEFCNRNGI